MAIFLCVCVFADRITRCDGLTGVCMCVDRYADIVTRYTGVKQMCAYMLTGLPGVLM